MQYLLQKNYYKLQTKVVNVTENPEQGSRLEALIETLNLTQTSIAQELGISQGYVSQMVSGNRNISRKVLHFITKTFPNVDVRWLITGEGEMFLFANGKKSGEPEAGILTGMMEPEPPAYVRGEGRLEWLERKVRELEDRVRRLEGEDGKE